MNVRTLGVVSHTKNIGIGHHGKDNGSDLYDRGHPQQGRASQGDDKGWMLGSEALQDFVTLRSEFRNAHHLEAPRGQDGCEARHSLLQAG